MNIGKATTIFKDIHNEETEVEDKITAIQEVIDMPTYNAIITKKSMLEVTCKHSTGHAGMVAVYTLPTYPNMHIIKGKYVAVRRKCKDCRFYEQKN